MKIRRKTRKRGGMVPRRVSLSRRASSSHNAPSGIAPPPSYNGFPPSYHNMLSQPSNRRQPVNRSPVSPPVSFNAASSSNVPPGFNAPPPPPIYTPETHEIGTVMNAPETHEIGTGMNAPNSREMGTGMNAPHSREIGIQKNNNNNGRNIPNMTEDELLQQYTSVYEKMTSKADAAESAALLKPHLKTIQNPIAFYITAHMDINNDGRGIYKNASLHAFIITRNNVHSITSTFKAYPRNVSYPTQLLNMRPEQATALGYPNEKNVNTLTYYPAHQFKKPLDSRLIYMFQTISKIPAIGQTTTGWMPDIFRYPYPIGNPFLSNGLFMTICRAL